MAIPWRTGMEDRPEVDFDRPLERGRPLKRWRWIGVFAEDVWLCAASARIGPLPVSWWAVWDRRTRTLTERTVRRPMAVPEGTPAGASVETISLHGEGLPIWTRKTPVSLTGTVRVGARAYELRQAPGLTDESAGYHARHTEWRWWAGVGATPDGRPVAWNLCDGMHDAPQASERTVWLDGEPHHVGPDALADLGFSEETRRVHKENRLVVATDYAQPFGTASGTLPFAGPVAGAGVTERQSVRW